MPLLGLCDTAIAGHLGEVSALGAIAVGATMINVIIWLMGFLRMGTTGMTARMYGEGNEGGCRALLKRGLWLALLIGAATVAAQYPLGKGLEWLLTPEGSVRDSAGLYFRICVWGIPANLAVMVATGWFIGLQNTVIPMAIAIGQNAVNIPLSVWLAFGCEMGIAGVAGGTLISQWLAAGAAVGLAARRTAGLRAIAAHHSGGGTMSRLRAHHSIRWGEFFRVNGDLFLRSSCMLAVTLAMTAFGARMGEVTLGVNAVMMQFFLFFSYFMDGFAYAGEALVGKASGAGDGKELRLTVRGLLRWGPSWPRHFSSSMPSPGQK